MKGASVLSMDQPRYCRHCGKKLEPGSTHCIYCGAEVAVHISFKGGKRSADSLKAWKRITISLAAITAVLTVIFAGLIWDRFGKNGTVPQDSAEAAPESAPVSEEAAESEAAADPDVNIVGCSALLTTTMPSLRDTVAALNKAPNRSQFKIMVGGAPITQEFADEIGADCYTDDAAAAAEAAKKLVQG